MLPPIRVTTDGAFLHIVTDPDYLTKIDPIVEESLLKAPMIPYKEGKTVGNVVLNPAAIGFSQEAVELIQSSLVISGDLALVSTYQSLRGAMFSWIGSPTMTLPAAMLTITTETPAFDFSQFQQIPNHVPGYSVWLRMLGLEPHAEHHAR